MAVDGSRDTRGHPRVHGLDQELEVFDSSFRKNAVPEVEDVAWAAGRAS